MKKIVGITGNIGAGKSAAAKILSKYPNVLHVDTDTLAKEIAARPEHASAIEAILGFAPDFVSKEGRARISAAIFGTGNEVTLKAYTEFIHPLVWKECERIYDASPEGTMVIVESAILFETHSEDRYDRIIVVACDDEIRADRLHNGPRALPVDVIRRTMGQQMPQAEKIAKAHYVLINDRMPDDLERHIQIIYPSLQDLLRKAMVVLSGDPPTLGHEWIIEQARKKYGSVHVAITANAGKTPMFAVGERVAMLKDIVPSDVEVSSFEGTYSVDYAESIGATVMVRGRRNHIDEIAEATMARFNQGINPSVETVVLDSPLHLTDVSSSAIKMLLGCRGWEAEVAKYVSAPVLIRIIAKQHDLFRRLQKRGAKGDELEFWKKVVTPYLESSRHYHDIKHIGTMLWDLKSVAHLCNDIDVIELAIWMHDAVYDTQSPDYQNVVRSGFYARKLASELELDLVFRVGVEELVVAAKHDASPKNKDQEIIADLDLTILGSLPRVFDLYEKGIREEYSWVPEDAFRTARAAILEKFLERPIFMTDFFRDRFEEKARTNLIRSVQQLRK